MIRLSPFDFLQLSKNIKPKNFLQILTKKLSFLKIYTINFGKVPWEVLKIGRF